MTEEFSNDYIRSMLKQRWRERSLRGVWFYGTWLYSRYPIIGATVGCLLGVAVTIGVLRVVGVIT